MTIRSVDKMWSRTNSSFKLSDKFRKLNASFTEAYQILHTTDTTELEKINAPGIPAAGTSYPGFAFVYADTAKIQTVSPNFSIATVDYNGEVNPKNAGGSTGSGGGGDPSPIAAPAKIDRYDIETQEECDEDWDGNALITANGEPITGIMRPVVDQAFIIRKNMLFFDSYVQARYRLATNSDYFLGWAPGTVRCTGLSATNVYDQYLGYWEVTGVFQCRYPYRTTPDKAWYARVRHEGFYERLTTSGVDRIERAQDSAKDRTKPCLLDATGKRLADPVPGQKFQAYWLEFKLFDSLPFNALGFFP